MERKNILPVSLDLYLRTEDSQICGMMHNLTLGKWLYAAGLDHFLLYLDSLITRDGTDTEETDNAETDRENGVLEIPAAFVRIPARGVKKLELRVTGRDHHSLQGEVICSEEGIERTSFYDSSLKLLRLIHDRVRE